MSTPCAAASEAGRMLDGLPSFARPSRAPSGSFRRRAFGRRCSRRSSAATISRRWRKSKARPASASSPRRRNGRRRRPRRIRLRRPLRVLRQRRLRLLPSRASPTGSTPRAAPGTRRSRVETCDARGRLPHGRLPGEIRRVQRRRRLRGNVRQHGGRVRRPQRRGRHIRVSIRIRRSAIRPATPSPTRRGRRGSTASSIRRCATQAEPASWPCGRTRCSRSRRARSTGSNGPAIRSRRSRPFPSSGAVAARGCARYRRGGKVRSRHRRCRVAPILRLNASASNCALTATVLSSRGSGHCAVAATRRAARPRS